MAAGRRGPNKKRGPKTKSKWKDDYLTIIPELIKTGKSVAQVAKIIKVHRDTVYEWKSRNKKFSDLLTTAQDDYNCGRVEVSQLKRSIGYRYTETTQELDSETNKLVTVKKVRKYLPGDPGSQQFFLKNRDSARWKDKHEIEGGLTILSPAEVKKDIPDV